MRRGGQQIAAANNPCSALPAAHCFAPPALYWLPCTAEVLGVPEDEFSTPVLLEGTYPPAIFINMQRDSSEQQQQRLVGWLAGWQLRLWGPGDGAGS